MTGTWRSSTSFARSFEQRARRTPPPARITGRSAPASAWRTLRTSSSSGRAGCGRTLGTLVPSGSCASSTSSGSDRTTGPGRSVVAWTHGLAEDVGRARRIVELGGEHAERPNVSTMSTSWNASRPRSSRSTWPMSTNIGGRVRLRGMDADREVRGSDRARPEACCGSSGELAVRFRGERGGAFVAGGDDADAGRLQRFERAEEALAGDGERDRTPAARRVLRSARRRSSGRRDRRSPRARPRPAGASSSSTMPSARSSAAITGRSDAISGLRCRAPHRRVIDCGRSDPGLRRRRSPRAAASGSSTAAASDAVVLAGDASRTGHLVDGRPDRRRRRRWLSAAPTVASVTGVVAAGSSRSSRRGRRRSASARGSSRRGASSRWGASGGSIAASCAGRRRRSVGRPVGMDGATCPVPSSSAWRPARRRAPGSRPRRRSP